MYRDQNQWMAKGNWPAAFKTAYNTENPHLAVCGEVGCGKPACGLQWPDGTPAHLCDTHAKGLFCLGCGSFTGGTEDIFRFGAYECANCHWPEWDQDDDYEDQDEDDLSGVYCAY